MQQPSTRKNACNHLKKQPFLTKSSFPQRSDRKQRRDGERKGSSHILFPQMEENNENEQKSRIPCCKPTWKNGRMSVCLSVCWAFRQARLVPGTSFYTFEQLHSVIYRVRMHGPFSCVTKGHDGNSAASNTHYL